MFELQWRKKYQPLNLLQVFYPSMSAKLTPQEYGKLGSPFGKYHRKIKFFEDQKWQDLKIEVELKSTAEI